MRRPSFFRSLGSSGFAGLGVLSLVLGGVACSAADPGVEGLTRQGQKYDGGSPNPVADSGVPVDSGGGGDAGVDAAPAQNAFTGAPAYVSQQPATSAKQEHTNNGVGVVPDKSQKCLDCHKQGGSGVAFLFGGTAYGDMNGGTPAANKEIRVRTKANGTGYIAHSDADGNFWFKAQVAGAYPAQTGIRDNAKQALMNGDISDGNCNGCHDGNGTKVVYLQ
jgi:hypothetical protein